MWLLHFGEFLRVPRLRRSLGSSAVPLVAGRRWNESGRVRPQDEAKGTCEAKLTVVLRPSSPHNSIDEAGVADGFLEEVVDVEFFGVGFWVSVRERCMFFS